MLGPELEQTLRTVFGAAGAAWVRTFPELIRTCEQRWGLQVEAPFPDLSYHYVAPARRADGSAVVLKLGVPRPDLNHEIEALRLYAGRGVVRLLDADVDLGALLLERLEPGASLNTVSDEATACSLAAGAMWAMWRPLPERHPFPGTADWGKGFERMRRRFGGGSGPLPAALADEAESLFRELQDSAAEPVLLHGDLHHGNILAAAREPWLVIDPKGLAGEPAYEVGAFLRNPHPTLLQRPDVREVTARRVDQFAEELQLPRERIRGWALAQAVLSAWWTIEDGESGWEWAVAVAELLHSLPA